MRQTRNYIRKVIEDTSISTAIEIEIFLLLTNKDNADFITEVCNTSSEFKEAYQNFLKMLDIFNDFYEITTYILHIRHRSLSILHAKALSKHMLSHIRVCMEVFPAKHYKNFYLILERKLNNVIKKSFK